MWIVSVLCDELMIAIEGTLGRSKLSALVAMFGMRL